MTSGILLLVELVIMLLMIAVVFFITLEFYRQTTASFTQVGERLVQIQREALR